MNIVDDETNAPVHRALCEAGLTEADLVVLRRPNPASLVSPWGEIARILQAEWVAHQAHQIAVGDMVTFADSRGRSRGQVCGIFGTGTGSDRDREVYAAVAWDSNPEPGCSGPWMFPIVHRLYELRKNTTEGTP